jgi:hypothetical protein
MNARPVLVNARPVLFNARPVLVNAGLVLVNADPGTQIQERRARNAGSVNAGPTVNLEPGVHDD